MTLWHCCIVSSAKENNWKVGPWPLPALSGTCHDGIKSSCNQRSFFENVHDTDGVRSTHIANFQTDITRGSFCDDGWLEVEWRVSGITSNDDEYGDGDGDGDGDGEDDEEND